jgi:hypothetical protein
VLIAKKQGPRRSQIFYLRKGIGGNRGLLKSSLSVSSNLLALAAPAAGLPQAETNPIVYSVKANLSPTVTAMLDILAHCALRAKQATFSTPTRIDVQNAETAKL